jgi:hypothetical protein
MKIPAWHFWWTWLVALLLGGILVTTGCAWPVEAHGGVAPRPAAPDVVFVGAGAATHTLALVTRRPWWQRVAADALLAWAVRVPRWGGRTEGASLLVGLGAFGSEWSAWVFCRGPCR